MNEHVHSIFQPILNGLFYVEEKSEGLDEVIELWQEFKQETTVVNTQSESSEAASGEETAV